jgi:hypothetical protein
MEVDFADAKVSAGFYLFDAILECFEAFARLFIVCIQPFADVSVMRFGRDVDRTIHCSQQDAQPTGVIAMLVSYQDGVELLDVFAHQRQPARDLPGAESGINQNTSFAGNDQNRIAS